MAIFGTKAPSSSARYVVLGADGKEYPTNDKSELAKWFGAGNVTHENKVWVTADQRWTTIGELGIRKSRPIMLTTGDIDRPYEVLDVLFAFASRPAPALASTAAEFPRAFSDAADILTRDAKSLGADAVTWIRHQHEWAGQLGGVGVSITGTAVKFRSAHDT